jgi:hypothetical protein
MVDEFVFLDDVQFSRGDFRNRNRIVTPTGIRWLTLPVVHKYPQKISEVKIANRDWAKSHWSAIHNAYKNAPYFFDFNDKIVRLYRVCGQEDLLSRVNRVFITEIARLLGIKTEILSSDQINHKGIKTDRLISICEVLGAGEYLSGPSAANYLEEEKFKKSGIHLSWMNYEGYPQYRQSHSPFEHQVSIIDLIFNLGPETNKYLKSFNSKAE